MLKPLIIVLIFFAAQPAMADADRVRDYVVRELRDDGYSDIRISRTWLGRMRFVAEQQGSRREIVVNPATGVILRDYILLLEHDGDTETPSGPQSSEGNEEEDDDDEDEGEDEDGDDGDDDGSDNDDEDEDDDDDDESDNSGSGSSNSGSGSSNSGSGSDDD